MFWVILGSIFILSGVVARFINYGEQFKALGRKVLPTVLFIAGFFCYLSTSIIHVRPNEVGHLNKVYGFTDLPAGQIIARNGEKGPQAEVLGPGYHFSPLVNVIYNYEAFPTTEIPENFYGQLVAKDGKPLPPGTYIAPGFEEDQAQSMLDAKTFLEKGGYRGPQETVLEPGTYRLNHYLFDVKFGNDPDQDNSDGDNTRATIIPVGFVGVVKSNIGNKPVCREEKAQTAYDEGALTVTLVPRGCVGIWNETLLPGAFYLNRSAYQVTPVDTRVQTWNYQGGYTKRFIDLAVDQTGKITQTPRSVEQPVPDGAADSAVLVKIEGWDIPVELRVLVQIDSKTAPIVVGAVGGLDDIENRILTPTIRSIVRNIAGTNLTVPKRKPDGTAIDGEFETRPTKVLDLIENREAIEASIEKTIKIEGRKAGIEIKEIRLGEPAIPPELLVSRLREQLAQQLKVTYQREKEAQDERINTEQARATADQQDTLVTAQIKVQVAAQTEVERETLGRGERKYLENLSAGQKAQAVVLGEDRVAMLQALDKVLETLHDKPELATMVNKFVPNIMVTGENGGGLSGAAAILGNAMTQKNDASAAKN